MIILNKETESKIRRYVEDMTTFLNNYRWIQDAYVSDFFFRDHWSKLPSSWQNALGAITTQELSCLVDRGSIKTSDVLPLSLLSFRQCTQTYSLDRQPSITIEEVVQRVFPGVLPSSVPTDTSYVNIHPEGNQSELHSYFRKHVKPKKQHEILNLAKVLSTLCSYLPCETVVDVGAGLGHLSRLLTFGHHLNTISVEAAGSHAPKATKYDREVQLQLHKKQIKEGNSSGMQTTGTSSGDLPCHVTNMIQPNMTTEDFLSIIQQQRNKEHSSCLEQDTPSIDLKTCNSNDKLKRHSSCQDEGICTKAVKISTTCLIGSQRTTECKNFTDAAEIKDNCGNHHYDINNKNVASQTNVNFDQTAVNHRSNKDDVLACSNCNKVSPECGKVIQECGKEGSNDSIFSHEAGSRDTVTDEGQNVEPNCDCGSDQVISSSESSHSRTCAVDKHKIYTTDWKFVLTGLHACGDLTPTFLRFFVNCGAAHGLASVGCCYMKMSEQSPTTDVAGYPMSQFVSALPDHFLSFNGRELACHFADTYSERLKGDSPHLKIHSYRAALEWIANQLNPTFERTSVQIPAKKTNQMDFKGYACLGLKKLGLSADLATTEMFEAAEAMTRRWKDVVAFYTIRLSLAPVIETLILLDRSIYLLENGYQSALVPIFDPALSPRNFVLLSWKT